MASFWAETGEITSPASTGNQSYNFTGAGNGLTPKAIIFFGSFKGAGSTGADDWRMVGFTTGSTAARNQCHCFQNNDGVGTVNLTVGYSETSCIFKNDDNATTTDLEAVLVSFDTDGFTLNWTTTASGIKIQYVALGGDDLEVYADNVDIAASTGNQTETGIPFEPKALITLWSKQNTNGVFSSEDSGIGVGVAVSSSQRWIWLCASDDGATVNEFYGDISSNVCYKILTESTGAVDGEGDFVAFTSDGFTVNRSNATVSAFTLSYLALGGNIQVAAGTETAPTSATTKSTNVGFSPQLVMLAGVNNTAVDNDAFADADRAMSFGFGVPSADSRCSFWIEDSGSDPIDCNAGDSATKCISIRSPTAIGTVSAEADIDASSSNSFVLNWTTAGTAYIFGYLAIAALPKSLTADAGSYSVNGTAADLRTELPYYVASGAGAAAVAPATTLDVPWPSGLESGDLVFMHIRKGSAGVADPTLPSGWTTELDTDSGSTVWTQIIWSYISDGTETGNLTVTVPSTGTGIFMQMHAFRSIKSGTGTWVIESAAFQANGNDTSVEMPSITSSVNSALAVAFQGANVNSTIGDASGESGGNWTETLAEYNSAAGNLATMQLQTAALPATTISGGSATLGAGAFAISQGFSIYVDVDTGVDDLIADPGSYTVTGQTAGTQYGRVVAANAGSYAVTGQTAALEHDKQVIASAGSYAVTGQTAALEHDKLLDAGAGSYAVTGQDATLSKGLTLNAEAGSYAVTGQDATFDRTYAVDAGAGSYAVNGTDAALSITDRVIDAGAGSYAVTGQDAALNKGLSVVAGAGSYAVTGQDATLTRTYAVDAGAGSYAVTGQAAALEFDRQIIADAGSYAVTGQDAALIYEPLGAFELIADAGSYAVTGSDADLYFNRLIEANAGGYVITGSDADLTYTPTAPAAEPPGGGHFLPEYPKRKYRNLRKEMKEAVKAAVREVRGEVERVEEAAGISIAVPVAAEVRDRLASILEAEAFDYATPIEAARQLVVELIAEQNRRDEEEAMFIIMSLGA